MRERCMFIQGTPVDIRTATHWHLDRLQHTRRAACLIAQKYSSVNLSRFALPFPKAKTESAFLKMI